MTLPSKYRPPNSRDYVFVLEEILSEPFLQGFFIIAILGFSFLGYLESLESGTSPDNHLYKRWVDRIVDFLTYISGLPSSTIYFSLALVAFSLLIFPIISSRI